MNKKLTSLLLALVMVFGLAVSAVPAQAEDGYNSEPPLTVSVRADKTEAHPGDTVTVEIYLSAVKNWADCEFSVYFSEGLTYVENSAVIAAPIKAHFQGGWTEKTKAFVPYGGNYTSDTEFLLLTVQCTVEDSAVGKDVEVYIAGTPTNYDIGFAFFDANYLQFHQTDDRPSATIRVTAAPVAATGISLNKTATTIYTGSNETLIATVTPANSTDTVVWTSSNPDVATVDNTGKVTAVAEGSATITATAGTKSATCAVKVEKAPCTHTNKTTVAAKDSTCAEKGWDAYEQCNDCGTILTADGKIPFRPLSTNHAGGTATCVNQAVCDTCHASYGPLGSHDYTVQTKKTEALKTAGTCKDNAVYYYSCSVCGAVESNDSHTFTGDKNSANHVGGTTIVNAADADHRNQVSGYTGDTKCLGCNEIIAAGTEIAPGAHVPASTWSSDETNHWKVCSVDGCGIVIEGSSAAHTSTGDHVATCQHKAVCDVCGASYGELADHDWVDANCTEPKRCSHCDATEGTPNGHALENTLSFDKDNHWNACANCDHKENEKPHEYGDDDICDACGYVKGSLDPVNPGTGDNAKLVLWVALLLVSGVAVCAVAVYTKKKRV